MSPPTIGLFAVNSHACADPEAAAGVAGLAERLGYDSLWAGEHVVVPSPLTAGQSGHVVRKRAHTARNRTTWSENVPI